MINHPNCTKQLTLFHGTSMFNRYDGQKAKTLAEFSLLPIKLRLTRLIIEEELKKMFLVFYQYIPCLWLALALFHLLHARTHTQLTTLKEETMRERTNRREDDEWNMGNNSKNKIGNAAAARQRRTNQREKREEREKNKTKQRTAQWDKWIFSTRQWRYSFVIFLQFHFGVRMNENNMEQCKTTTEDKTNDEYWSEERAHSNE